MLVSRDVPLAPFTTLRLGGRASRVASVSEEGDLAEALGDAEGRREDVLVLGGGSNVVIADEGFAGLVLRIASRGVVVERRGQKVLLDVAAGESWDSLVTTSVDEGWSGIESLAGIPGLVGATPIQNVGAYGHEVKETVLRVRAFDRQERRFVELDNAACAFGYRSSLFRGKARYVVARVVLELDVAEQSAPVHYAELARALGVKEGERAPARVVRSAVLALRGAKGMVLDPDDPDSVSAGSFFVNPTLGRDEIDSLERLAAEIPLRPGEVVPRYAAGADRFKVPAAWLVERAGFAKGYGTGRIGVSSKHSLALVNRGRGTTAELLELAREIRRGVKARLGVELSPEPVFVGCAL